MAFDKREDGIVYRSVLAPISEKTVALAQTIKNNLTK